MKFKVFIIITSIFFPAVFLFSENVFFRRKTPKINEERKFSLFSEQNIDTTIFQNELPALNFLQTTKNYEEKIIKALEVKNGRLSKVLVYFKEVSEFTKEGEIESSKSEKVSGKKYIIENKNEKLVATYPDGSIPPGDETEYIDENIKNIDYEIYFENNSLEIGERAVSIEKKLLEFFLSDSDFNKNINDLSVILKDIKLYNNKKCALFDLNVNASGQAGDSMTVSMPLKGEVLIETESSYPVFLKLEGPIYMNGFMNNKEGTQLLIKGKGSVYIIIKSESLQ